MSGHTATTTAFFALGVCSHVFYFMRGNLYLETPKLFALAVLSPTILFGSFSIFARYAIQDAFITAAVIYLSFMAGTFLSMGIYRAFFHRLRSVPGPFLARLSNFWFVSKTSDGTAYLQVRKLHQQYGDIVRIGPNEVSIADPEIVMVVHSVKSRCRKSDWYDQSHPMTTLQQMRDRKMHARRRRVWDEAFTAKSLRAYEGNISKHADLLVSKLAEQKSKAVNASDWMMYYTWDVMGQLAFSKSFGNVAAGQPHHAIHGMHAAMGLMTWMSHLIWVIQITNKFLPMSVNPTLAFSNYCGSCVRERKKIEPETPDVFHHLLKGEAFFDDPKAEDDLLTGDSRLVVVAGSDTTATTLAFALYHLVQTPELVTRLREELAANSFIAPDQIEPYTIAHLAYLNALINETLRLHPPVPSGVFRDTSPEGLRWGDHFVPGDVTIITPQYAIQTSEKAFTEPMSFVPERWTTRPEMILNKNAFFPFLTGTYGCVGKQVALMELRTVLAKLVLAFEIGFAKGENGKRLLEESKDNFTVTLGPLELEFKPRAGIEMEV